MHPLPILLIGVTIVIGGILGLRLHAFLALALAALTVAALTPQQAIERTELAAKKLKILAIDTASDEMILVAGAKQGVRPGMRYLVARPASDGAEILAEAEIERLETRQVAGEEREVAVARLVGDAWPSAELTEKDFVVHPFDLRAAQSRAAKNVGERVAEAFGVTCAQVGILIAMASIIGKCLLDSGAADKIVRSALRVVGVRGAPLGFVGSGFLLGIPVFFDTVFYLMMPLGKALHTRTGRDYLLYVLSIVAGATMAHSLVPPTPGPLFVGEALGVDLGLMIVAGCAVGLFSATSGYLFAALLNRFWQVPLRASPDMSLEQMQTLAKRPESELPPLLLSLAPIVLPVLLIGGQAIFKADSSASPIWSSVVSLIHTFGDKNLALTLAALIAMGTWIWKRRPTLLQVGEATQAAVASAGVIILITAAGGAFGAMLKQTGVSDLLEAIPKTSTALMITLAFLVTTAVRTAQGSATVAMITAVGILAPLAASGELGCHPVYVALAIGCGSKPIAWMNDSGFWVICKMSGMTEAEGLRTVAPMSVVMGVVGLAATLVGAMLWPLTP